MPSRYTHMLKVCNSRDDSFNNTMEDRNHIAQLLIKNLKGTLSPAEKQQLDTWIAASPVNRGIFENLNSPDKVMEELELQGEVARITTAARKRIEKAITNPQPVSERRSISHIRWWWYSAAAIVIIGLLTWLFISSRPVNTTPGGSARELLVTTTSKGQLRQLNLPDRSQVWLNVDSRIQSPKTFSETERKVQLEGSAFFNVKPAFNKGKKIPFIVSIKDGDAAVGEVEVLGTLFNINAYGSGQYYKATVLEGRIKVSNGSDSKIVEAKQVAHWTKNGPISVVAENEPEADISWKDSTLKFSNTPVQYVYQHLERVFDVTVQYKNNIKPERKFTGELHTPSGIRLVLNVINDQCDLSSFYDSSQRKVVVQ